jgi:hypothetical protein
MTHATNRIRKLALGSIALLAAGLGACHEDTVAPRTIPTPSGPMGDLGTYIVHVDVKHQTVDVHPAGQMVQTPSGVDAQIYGAVGQIRHVFFLHSATPIGGTGAEYHLSEDLKNLLPFAIGTNSPHTFPTFPQDTMGVYVFLSIPVFNIRNISGACVSGCSVVMDSADGAYPFSSPTPQPYMYWKTILESPSAAADSARAFTDQTSLGGTHVHYFRNYNFLTTGSVTDFSFGLSVSAAWVDPNDNRWKVFYAGDSLPNRIGTDLQHLQSEPDWRVLGTGGGTATIQPPACVANTGACQLQIVSGAPTIGAKDTLMYFRSDSVRASQSAYIQATMSTSLLGDPTKPSVFLGLKDPAKLVQMGISTTRTGFTDSTGAFVGTTIPTDLSRTIYRVSKFGTDSAGLYTNNSILLVVPYSALPAAPPLVGSDRFFFFGNITQTLSVASTSLWSNVNYEIGSAFP